QRGAAHIGHQQQCLAHGNGDFVRQRRRLTRPQRHHPGHDEQQQQGPRAHEASAPRRAAAATVITRRAGTCSPSPPISSSICETGLRAGEGARSNSLLLRTATGNSAVSCGLRSSTERSPACCASSTRGASFDETRRVTVAKLREALPAAAVNESPTPRISTCCSSGTSSAPPPERWL